MRFKILITIIVILSILFGVYQIKSIMIAEGDAYSRALISKQQATEYIFFKTSDAAVWLPLHFSILSIPQLIGIEAFFGQRLITVLISSLSIIALFLYTKECTNNKNLSLLSSFIYAIFPLRLFLSTQTLSESIFVFFLILSIYYLIKEKDLNKNLLLSLFFLNMSHAIRYEAWLIIPLLWFYIIIKNEINYKIKFSYFQISLAFPIYWILNNAFRSNGISFAFFKEKYRIAQIYIMPEYYNLNLSYKAWENQIIKIFPVSYLIITFAGYKNFIKKIEPKKIIFYVTPIYLFLILVIQVYFGTMEWFPTRYLLIPTTFLIPILAQSSLNLFNKFKEALKNEKRILFSFFIWSLILTLSTLVLNEYSQLYKDSEYYLTTESFLSSFNNIPKNIEDSLYYQDFKNLKEELDKNKGKRLEFYVRDNNQSWNDQALFYFLNKQGFSGSKDSFLYNHEKESVIVWERELESKENNWYEEFEIKYANNNYFILEYNL